MAIVLDSSALGTQTSNTTTISWPHTISSNTNGVLVALLADNTLAGTISSIKFAGQAMTRIIRTNSADSHAYTEMWYLLAPPTGLGTFNGTWTGSTANKKAISLAYTGVDQTVPISGSSAGSSTAGASGSVTTSLGANGLFVGGMNLEALPGTTDIGVQRGTITTNTKELLASDSTGGTLRWTSPTTSMAFVGAGLAAQAGISNLIQSSGTANLAAGSTQVTFSSNMTAGNLIVVGVTLSNAASLGTVSSVTDNQNNTYSFANRGTLSEATSVIDEEIWYASNITGGAGTVTVNHTTDNCAVFAREYSGFDTLDVTSSATGSSTTPNTGTVSTTVATELLVVSTGDDKGVAQTFTAAGAYVDMVGTTATLTDISMEDGTVGVTGAQTGTLTLGAAANWVSNFASFYKAASGKQTFTTLTGAGNI